MLAETATQSQTPLAAATRELRIKAQRRPKTGVYYTATDFKSNPALSERLANLPPQARVCYGILLSMGPRTSESDAMEEFNKRSNEFASKQDPWRIFQFYRKRLVELDLITVENYF